MAFVLLAWHLFPHCSGQEDGQHTESLGWPGELYQAVCEYDLLGQSPQLREGRAPVMPPTMSKTASSVPPRPALSIPMRSHLLSLLAPPLAEEWHQRSGASISKQLRVGLIYLSLGAIPFFWPLLSKMCLLPELLPLNTQFLGSCH